MTQKVIAIIPARYGSTRFPGKPLVDIKGKTMIQRVYEQVISCTDIDEVFVATDDQRISTHLEKQQIPFILTDADIQTGTERVWKAVLNLKLAPNDIVLNVQGDEPFISSNQLSRVLKAFENPETQIASLRKKIERIAQVLDPNAVKVVCDKDEFAHYFSRSPIPYIRNYPQDQWVTQMDFYKHIGIYGFRFNVLEKINQLETASLEKAESLEQLTWLWNGFKIKLPITKEESPSIDTPKDLENILKNWNF
ncbi:MAG: 3-deoxy-manno-octulosonate cytidylyltransferase [Flavobacteriales bacterium]|jgi:3-deoxy-manno-octulosonate cytidylyltransferase (CMP-KDO synthetase)|nr:3-deoxy-manno-octulosonate cytidylyltransferase [Flavobacteriales bacterium]